jgi:hypothetical protein
MRVARLSVSSQIRGKLSRESAGTATADFSQTKKRGPAKPSSTGNSKNENPNYSQIV